ncbi:MAG: hypothetical protein U0Q18_06895 [Bryobacteraceae bacterium]
MNRINCSFRYVSLAWLAVAGAGLLYGQTLQVSPATVALSAQTGSSATVSTTLSVASSGDTTGSHLLYSAFLPANSPAWLSITPGTPSGTTPGSFTVSANPAGLSGGTYTGQVIVFANAPGGSTIAVAVTFNVGQLGASPASLSFSYHTGGSLPAPQTLAISGPASPVGFTAAASVASGSNWLQVAPTTGNTPANVTVSLNSTVLATLGQGTYTGTVTLTPSSGSTTPLQVPVTLTITGTPLVSVSPASMSFQYQIGGAVSSQTLSVTSAAGDLAFAATATVAANPAGTVWLLVNPSSGNTPSTLTVTFAPAGLPAGTYTGQVTINAPGAPPVTVAVTLLVTTNPLLVLTPSSLEFDYQVGTANPAPQNIATASSGVPIPFTVAAATATGGSWLSVTSSGTTPNSAAVSVNPMGMSVGTYTGTITFTAASAGNSPQQIPVTLKIGNDPLILSNPNTLMFLYQTGKSVPVAQTINLTSNTGATLNYTISAFTTDGANWLSATPSTGATPSTASIAVSTAGLAVGKYTGTVKITATNPTGVAVPNSPLNIPVTLYVSDHQLIQANPSNLTFTAGTGGLANPQEIAFTSTGDPLNLSITAQTSSGGPWLTISTPPTITPGTMLVSAAALNLSAGTYSGTITVTASNPSGDAVADSPLTIPVTLLVPSGTISAAPASLSFTQTLSGSAPAAQTVNVTGTGPSALSFTAAAVVTAGVNWLTVTPAAGTTPSALSVSVDGSKLSPGTYQGTVTITSPGASGSPQVIQVTLTVSASPSITLTPATLAFTYQLGGSVPAAQAVQVASSSGNLPFTVAASTSGSSGNWLSVTPASGTSPGSLSVAVNPAGLATGTYNGTVTVSSTGAGNSPQSVAVTLTVAAGATPVPTTILNAASGAPGEIAPGEIISIYGTSLGPVQGLGAVVSNGKVTTTLNGIQVLFDGLAAPLLYVSSGQINAVVPFEIAGRFQTHMQISNNGTLSNTLDLSVTSAAPGLFTLTQNGAGQGAILNSTGTVNGTNTPSPKNTYVVLYATGGGQTSPIGVTGNVSPANGSSLKQVPNVSVTVGGLTAKVLYAGTAPGFIEGALQLNVQLPDGVGSGAQPVLVTVNGVSSQTGVTIAIQ